MNSRLRQTQTEINVSGDGRARTDGLLGIQVFQRALYFVVFSCIVVDVSFDEGGEIFDVFASVLVTDSLLIRLN